jgi:hypothetical protein
MEPLPDTTPLSEARDWLRERVERKGGGKCPVCSQHAEVYKRSVYATVARFLIGLYWMTPPDATIPDAWVSARAVAERYGLRLNEGGDRSKLRYWDLVDIPDAVRADGSPRTGYFRITSLGRAYAEDRHRIRKTAVIYDDRVLRFEGPEVGIRDALRKRFDYDALMNGNG